MSTTDPDSLSCLLKSWQGLSGLHALSLSVGLSEARNSVFVISPKFSHPFLPASIEIPR